MLELVAESTDALISTDDAKAHLRITHSHEDAKIDRIVEVARQYIEDDLGRSLLATSWDERFGGFPGSGQGLKLARAPLRSVESIIYRDENDAEQTRAAASYVARMPRETQGVVYLVPGYTWPVTRVDRAWPVVVRYVAGYGDIPAHVPPVLLQAAFMLLDYWYRHTDGLAAQNLSDAMQGSVRALLNQQTTGAYP